MKVGVLPMAQALPKIALMRLSAYHKALGDEVIFRPTPMFPMRCQTLGEYLDD